ncbi:hypothetical protein F5Y15DRAFT_217566 [Xylariaceae sp. FL0016]|nr:hypothetical protein F5Y15DRAFT_217566 [Xylariaceae sp. FL0016]
MADQTAEKLEFPCCSRFTAREHGNGWEPPKPEQVRRDMYETKTCADRGKGQGLFATKPIPRSTLLILERFMVSMIVPDKKDRSRQKKIEVRQAMVQRVRVRMDSAIGDSNFAQDFLALSKRPGLLLVDEEIQPTWTYNRHTYLDAEGTRYWGIFPTLSRVNHSCVSNAAFAYNTNIVHMELQATKNIQEGEEVTISYVNPGEKYEERNTLLQRWEFACACVDCKPESRDIHDAWRSELGTIQKTLEHFTRTSLNGPAGVHSLDDDTDEALAFADRALIIVKDTDFPCAWPTL